MTEEVSTMIRSREGPASTFSGYPMLLVLLAAIALAVWMLVSAIPDPGASKLVKIGFVGTIFAAGLIALLVASGFYMIQPNQGAVITLFGEYRGTDRKDGLRWRWPWMGRNKVSVRSHNIHSGRIKINDKRGNPIDIACNLVWRVRDTAQAVFDVDDYREFVNIQIEAGLRTVGARHPYDDFENDETTLRGSPDVINAELQAEAVIAARTKLVMGAVSMVDMALDKLKTDGVVDLDDERRAAMVSNLMVVLCGEREVNPVVNAGSLYQ